MSHDTNVAVEVLCVPRFKHVGIPVIASRTDTDDAALTVVRRIFPGHDGSVSAHTDDGGAGAGSPGIIVIISSPVSTDVILSR